MVVLRSLDFGNSALDFHLRGIWRRLAASMVGNIIGLRSGFVLHITYRSHHCNHKPSKFINNKSSNQISSYWAATCSNFLSIIWQQPGLNIITEYIIGLILPGKPLANVTFKTYGYISMAQALTFLSDFNLGHYMKIPPKSMFITQVIFFLVW